MTLLDGAFVIRDAEAGVPRNWWPRMWPRTSTCCRRVRHAAHPTQGLLDALTVAQRKGHFEGLAIAIVGDLRHSRVARSAWHALRILGVSGYGSPPRRSCRRRRSSRAVRHTHFATALKDADVVMILRIQKERMSDADLPDGERFHAAWGLTRERLALARPDAIVMHPQPMNRGIEIASEVADGPQSVIRDQVRNGSPCAWRCSSRC